jgi:hypothetical protein
MRSVLRSFVPAFVLAPAVLAVSGLAVPSATHPSAAVPSATASSTVPSAAGSSPPALVTSGDSVLVRFGDYRGWAHLTGVPSPDSTWLSPDHDLFLSTGRDSLVVPRSKGSATVRFVRAADTLAVVFFFQTADFHNLQRYRALLRKYSRFDSSVPDQPLAFDDSRDAESEELRQLFPLDSIAGPGSDLSRMRRLLVWVHHRFRWDGNKENPRCATVGRMMDSCMTAGLTLNCGGLAASYAAACRSVGIPARQIVCLPFDRADHDCHSVTIVYSDSLRRWVYMDPTFNAWWTDRAGNLLGLEQSRVLLAAGDTVLVNPGADLNGSPRDPLAHLAYMSKNLFCFKTWLADRTPIYLNPAGYDSIAAAPGPRELDAGSRTTDNPAVFWAGPATRSRR